MPSDGAAEPTVTLDAIEPGWFTAFMSAAPAGAHTSDATTASTVAAIARHTRWPGLTTFIDSASGYVRPA